MIVVVIFFNIYSVQIMNYLFLIIDKVPILDNYVDYVSFTDVKALPFDFLVYFCILLASFLVPVSKYKSNGFFNYLQISSFFATFFKGLSISYQFFDRISLYFSIMMIFLLPVILKNMRFKYSKYSKIAETLIVLLFMIYCFVRIYSGQSAVIDYNTIFYT